MWTGVVCRNDIVCCTLRTVLLQKYVVREEFWYINFVTLRHLNALITESKVGVFCDTRPCNFVHHSFFIDLQHRDVAPSDTAIRTQGCMHLMCISHIVSFVHIAIDVHFHGGNFEIAKIFASLCL